jgi:hypothetical protein
LAHRFYFIIKAYGKHINRKDHKHCKAAEGILQFWSDIGHQVPAADAGQAAAGDAEVGEKNQ